MVPLPLSRLGPMPSTQPASRACWLSWPDVLVQPHAELHPKPLTFLPVPWPASYFGPGKLRWVKMAVRVDTESIPKVPPSHATLPAPALATAAA